jgi:hypothetical protein
VERVKKPALVLSKTRKRTRRDTNKTAQSYSSGEWLVREGSEEDFTVWPLSDAPGDKSFVLVRSADEPRRFLSLRAWENQEAQESWRQMPRIKELLSQCRQLCEGVRVPPVHVSGLSEPVELLSCSGRAWPDFQRCQPHGGHSESPRPFFLLPLFTESLKRGFSEVGGLR